MYQLQRAVPIISHQSVQDLFGVCRQSQGQNIFQFSGRTSLCFTDQETQKENVLRGPTPLWVSTYTSYLLHKVQDPFSPCTVPWPKHCFQFFLGETSLCVTDQESQEENVLFGPTPFWVGTYTSYLLYKVQDPFSPCRQSHGQHFFQFF